MLGAEGNGVGGWGAAAEESCCALSMLGSQCEFVWKIPGGLLLLLLLLLLQEEEDRLYLRSRETGPLPAVGRDDSELGGAGLVVLVPVVADFYPLAHPHLRAASTAGHRQVVV
jgi:hypothetical protein